MPKCRQASQETLELKYLSKEHKHDLIGLIWSGFLRQDPM